MVAEPPRRLGDDRVEHAAESARPPSKVRQWSTSSVPCADGSGLGRTGDDRGQRDHYHRRPVLTFIRFDMRAPVWGPATAAELHTATLDMAEWADRVGFDSIVVSEHHGSADGFLPAPIVAAAAIAGRTRAGRHQHLRPPAPLHDPVRVAEDLAVLDLLSEGRVTTILGLGYRPEEYEMFDAPWDTRGAFFDDWVQALLDAWSGEPFIYRDRKVPAVTPPARHRAAPAASSSVGRSKAAARRAATLRPQLLPRLLRPRAAGGLRGGLPGPGPRAGLDDHSRGPASRSCSSHDDPDGYWERIGPHVLHEAMTYSGWQREGRDLVGRHRRPLARGAEGGRPLRRADPRRGRRPPPAGLAAPLPALRGHPARAGLGVAAPGRARGAAQGPRRA